VSTSERADPDAVLPDDVPVAMPELPLTLAITTEQQFKAIADPQRSRILGIIQNQPATAKQIADRLGAPPGTIGHHLQVLEAAELAKVVARRLVRGIVAKYYTRTARIFQYALPPEITGHTSISLDILTHARDEMAEAVVTLGEHSVLVDGFPHSRLSPERAKIYAERIDAVMSDFIAEPYDPEGIVCGMTSALFVAPPYLQGEGVTAESVAASAAQAASDHDIHLARETERKKKKEAHDAGAGDV
jgi:DNA-binding transcriptional ArsR family regulator